MDKLFNSNHEIQHLRAAVSNILNEESDISARIESFDFLDEYVENISNAVTFDRTKPWKELFELFKNKNPVLRMRAWNFLAICCQNNPSIQKSVKILNNKVRFLKTELLI